MWGGEAENEDEQEEDVPAKVVLRGGGCPTFLLSISWPRKVSLPKFPYGPNLLVFKKNKLKFDMGCVITRTAYIIESYPLGGGGHHHHCSLLQL